MAVLFNANQFPANTESMDRTDPTRLRFVWPLFKFPRATHIQMHITAVEEITITITQRLSSVHVHGPVSIDQQVANSARQVHQVTHIRISLEMVALSIHSQHIVHRGMAQSVGTVHAKLSPTINTKSRLI